MDLDLERENEGLRKEVVRLKELLAAAENAAFRDPLTGLVNRVPLLSALVSEIALVKRSGKPVGGVLFLDLDGFKKINDTLGHSAGDAVLRAVADILLRQTRVEDIVSRFGGDEFVILLRGIPSPAELKKTGERITAALRRSTDVPLGISASVGGVMISSLFQGPEEIIKAADRGMYAAKNIGGNAVVIDDNGNKG